MPEPDRNVVIGEKVVDQLTEIARRLRKEAEALEKVLKANQHWRHRISVPIANARRDMNNAAHRLENLVQFQSGE